MQITMAVWRDSNLKKQTINAHFDLQRAVMYLSRSPTRIVCSGQEGLPGHFEDIQYSRSFLMEMKGLNEYNFTFLYSFKANNVMLMILDLASFFVKKLGNKQATKFHDVWHQNP